MKITECKFKKCTPSILYSSYIPIFNIYSKFVLYCTSNNFSNEIAMQEVAYRQNYVSGTQHNLKNVLEF